MLAAFLAFASRARPAVYWFQWGVHILPRPSFWLGWIGKSSGRASWGSIPKRADPLHRRRLVASSVIVVAPFIADAGLASRATSIARRA